MMRRLLARARLAIARCVCMYHPDGHKDRLILCDLGPLGEWAWWYCDRCTWASPMRYTGPSLRMMALRARMLFNDTRKVGRA